MRYSIICHGEIIMSTNLRKEAAEAWKYQQADATKARLYINGQCLGGTDSAKVPPAPSGNYHATKDGVEKVSKGVAFDKAEAYYYANFYGQHVVTQA